MSEGSLHATTLLAGFAMHALVMAVTASKFQSVIWIKRASEASGCKFHHAITHACNKAAALRKQLPQLLLQLLLLLLLL
jgi:hypothetical protein